MKQYPDGTLLSKRHVPDRHGEVALSGVSAARQEQDRQRRAEAYKATQRAQRD